jgi:putative spermidine/putrescine transport system permease protein
MATRGTSLPMSDARPNVSVGAAGVRACRYCTPFLLILPGLAVFALFFLLPLALLVLNSFYGYSRLTGIIPTITPQNYSRILSDSFYLAILLRTVRLACLTSIAVAIVGYPVALYLSIAPALLRGWIILFILSPLLVSVIVRTFGWLIILGPNGLLPSVFDLFGLPGSGVLLHTEAGVVIGLVNVLLPFFVLSVATSLQAIDPAVPLAAASLGASPWRVFFKVTLPLSLPGVLSGLLIVFSLASSSFVTPALLGGAANKVLSTVLYEQALVLQNWPFAAALAVLLVIVVLAILLVQNALFQRGRYAVVLH